MDKLINSEEQSEMDGMRETKNENKSKDTYRNILFIGLRAPDRPIRNKTRTKYV